MGVCRVRLVAPGQGKLVSRPTPSEAKSCRHLHNGTFRNSRLKAVKEVLGRHAAELTDKEEILQRMSVPREWLAEARVSWSCIPIDDQETKLDTLRLLQANLYASQGNVYSEFLSCKQAGLMDRAHNIVVQRLAPEVILREDVGLLRKLLAGLEDARVADWHKGGQVSRELVLERRSKAEVHPALDSGLAAIR